MKRTLYSILAASLFIVLSGCGGTEDDANDHANELCECLTDAGLDGSLSVIKLSDRSYMREMEDNMQEKVPQCAIKIFREMDKDLENLNKSEKKAYTKAFLKGCIDTDCTDFALDIIPYDMLSMALDQVEKEFDREKKYRERSLSEYEEEAIEDEALEELFR